MTSYYPTMKMATSIGDKEDDMHNVHGHVGNVSRAVILDSLKRIISSRSTSSKEIPISIADFGTADGQASMSLFKEMIDVIHADLGKEQAIVLYYNDQPMNEFNRLSKVIQVNRENSGQTFGNNVYSVIVPRTMYEQCLPHNSLDLAISFVATHYLSKPVCQIKNGVFIDEADDSERYMMDEQARADWRAFVISRGRELKPGGFLITICASSNDNDDVVMQLENGVLTLGRIVSDMAREGVISQEEYHITTFHGHNLRKPDDFKEPFTSALPEVVELGLELVSVKPFKQCLQHPIFDIVDKDDSEKEEYSRAIVASMYPWMHHVIYGGLSLSRTEDEKQIITEEFFHRLQKYAYDHSDHKPYGICTEVVIWKSHIQ